MVNGEVVKFKYPEIVADHYIYRGEVDNQISLESVWGTTWWSI